MIFPSAKDIYKQVLSDIQAETKSDGPPKPKSPWYVFASVLSVMAKTFYTYLDLLYKQLFVKTQGKEELLLTGSVYNLYPHAATSTTLTAWATGLDGSVISRATKAVGDNVIFYSDKEAVITDGKVLISFTSETAGQMSAISVITLSSPVEGVNNELTVESFLSGTEKEPLDDFRVRVAERIRARPAGSNIDSFKMRALEVVGIKDVIVANHSINPQIKEGWVMLYAMSNTPDRLLSKEKIAELSNYLNSDAWLSLGVAGVLVGNFSMVPMHVTVANLYPNESTIKNAFEELLQRYLVERFPTQYGNQLENKADISQVEITSLLVIAGAKRGVVRLYVENMESYNYSLLYHQLASDGGVTWM